MVRPGPRLPRLVWARRVGRAGPRAKFPPRGGLSLWSQPTANGRPVTVAGSRFLARCDRAVGGVRPV